MLEEPRNKLETEGTRPERQEGQLLKKRKWPLKGWHKVGWARPRVGPVMGPVGMMGQGEGVWTVPSLTHPFLSAIWADHTEILRAGRRDPSLCDYTARCESGSGLVSGGGDWPWICRGKGLTPRYTHSWLDLKWVHVGLIYQGLEIVSPY